MTDLTQNSHCLPLQDMTSESVPRLLYLPGMDGTGRLFYRQAKYLDPYFCLKALNFNQPSVSHLWEDLVAQVLDQMDPQRPTILCGESFGACLALQVAVAAPHLCHSLILINPASSFHRGPWWLAGRMVLPWIPVSAYTWMSEQGLPLLAELSRMDPVDQQQLLQAAQSVSPQVAHARMVLLSQFNPEQLPLQSLRIPTLLIAGARDRLLPSVDEVNRLAERMPMATVAIAPESGHACLLERELNLTTFLSEKYGTVQAFLDSGRVESCLGQK